MQLRKNLTIPPFTSALEFEKYTTSTPVFSSWQAGWEGLLVREFHEPAEVEEVIVPAVPDISLVLVTSGAMNFESRDVGGLPEVMRVQKGDLFLTAGGGVPYILRWQSLTSEPIQSIHMHLDAGLFMRIAEQVADYDPARLQLKDLSGFQDPLLAQMGLTLSRELRQPSSAAKLYAETAAQMLAVHLLNYYTTVDHRIKEYTHRLTRRQMTRIIEYIDAHLDEKLSLDTLAQQTGFSTYHFAYLFRLTTGETPHQYVLRQRLERSQYLLTKTDMPLSQIALKVGFQSQSHFTQVFKSRLGVTPRRYRQSC